VFLVSYDISDDRLRGRVALTLREYGFRRLQKSVYVGEVSRNVAEMLAIELGRLVKGSMCDVRIFPLCRRCYEGLITVSKLEEVEEAEEVIVT